MSDATEKPEYVLTDDMRSRAKAKPVFNILYIGDNDSYLSPFRGETIIRTFAEFYKNQAEITYMTASVSKLGKLTTDDLKDINILWIDNVSDFKSAQHLSDLNSQLLDGIEPNWKDTVTKLREKSEEEAIKYVDGIVAKRKENLRIVYALDEWVWEAPVGRANDVQTVQLIETFMNLSDSIVVPTAELKEAIKHYKFVADENKDITVIPSAVNIEFFPLFKNHLKQGIAKVDALRDKPRILIKGLAIPTNIEEFIIENYKKMDITICSVDEVNPHILGLIQSKKVSHIYHWANPYVNKSNISATYAIERDGQYDFVIHTKPDDLQGDLYELCTGDEDILFATAYGALPIAGVDHIGYEDTAHHLSNSCALRFGSDTTAKKIRSMIDTHMVPVTWNESYRKVRAMVENRIASSPMIGARYFSVMLGKDLYKARLALAEEERQKLENAQQENTTNSKE